MKMADFSTIYSPTVKHSNRKEKKKLGLDQARPDLTNMDISVWHAVPQVQEHEQEQEQECSPDYTNIEKKSFQADTKGPETWLLRSQKKGIYTDKKYSNKVFWLLT